MEMLHNQTYIIFLNINIKLECMEDDYTGKKFIQLLEKLTYTNR